MSGQSGQPIPGQPDAMKLDDYLDRLHTAFSNRDADQLMGLLSVTDNHIMYVKSWGFVLTEHVESAGKSDARFDRWMHTVIVAHIRCILTVCRDQMADAYNFQAEVVKAFTALFQRTPDDWMLAALEKITVDLRSLAEVVDRELQAAGKKPTKINEAVTLLRNGYGSLGKYNKACMLGIIVQLVRMYFSTNNLQGCKPLIRSVYSSNFLPIHSFPMAQQVTFNYYEGRLKLNDLEFKEANDKLTFALTNCEGSNKNKRLILLYLIPVRLVLGCPPKQEMLKAYDLMQYSEVTAAVCSGNFKLLNVALDKHEAFFLQHSVYYCLKSQLKFIMYRNLFKLTWSIKEPPTGEQRVLDLADVETATRVAGLDLDAGEVECIVANLIYKKKLKAYIAHQHRKIVFGKAPMVPFPALTLSQ